MFKHSWFLIIIALIIGPSFSYGQRTDVDNLVKKEAIKKGWQTDDVASCIVLDDYTSMGIQHIYLAQAHEGIPIKNSHIGLHLAEQHTYSTFQGFEELASYQYAKSARLSPEEAIQSVVEEKQRPNTFQAVRLMQIESGRQQYLFEGSGLSHSEIPVKLWYYHKGQNLFGLAWELSIDWIGVNEYINYFVDAESGEVVQEISWTVECAFNSCDHDYHTAPEVNSHFINEGEFAVSMDSSYNVFPWPMESPHSGPRVEVTKPWLDNTTASPTGWHTIGPNNYQHSRGNNVDAYEDSNNSNGPTGGNAARADGGANLDFDFPWTANGPVSSYMDAATTNLFYWSNVCHDVWFNYGFDEASGNFQEENFTPQGLDSDYVRAEAQDGGGSCNANMSTPPDGSNPRIQMYTCSGRDGSMDNIVIVHEYGHGISIRLTGGPSTSSCLSGHEQMGEGWSDYFGVVMTIDSTDIGTDARGVGTWLFGQGPNGPGIRPYPYSTDLTINPMEYENIKTYSVPHGVGSVWASMLWDMTWGLIDVYGFDPDIYNGSGGNNMSMALVTLGLKLQPCNPGFIDGRDAILAADSMLYGGANQCIIWEAFARRGLGWSAYQGSGYQRYDGISAYDLPPTCFPEVSMSSDGLFKRRGDTITFTVRVLNNQLTLSDSIHLIGIMPDSTHFVSASNGGILDNGEVIWPGFTVPPGDSVLMDFVVTIDSTHSYGLYTLYDDVENGNNLWEVENYNNTEWVIQSNTSNSGTSAWFANNAGSMSIAFLELKNPIGVFDTTELTFWHSYNTESGWDGGRVMISLDHGQTWEDLGPYFVQNGYNSTIYNALDGFSGNSGGFIESKVDLSSFTGNSVKIRFQMECDWGTGGLGWYIDDISIDGSLKIVDNSFKGEKFSYVIDKPVVVVYPPMETVMSSGEVSCGGTSDGWASVKVAAGGSGVFTYLWDTGGTTDTIFNLTAGTYFVTINDGFSDAVDSVVVLPATQSMITDRYDNGGTENLRYFLTTGYCPNDTLIFHPSLFGDTIIVNSEIPVTGINTIIGFGKNDLTISGQDITPIFNINNHLSLESLRMIRGYGLNFGGAFINRGQVSLKDVLFEKNYEGTTPKAFSQSGMLNVYENVEIKE